MKVNTSALRWGLLIAASTLNFNGVRSFAQIVSIDPITGREQLSEALSYLQKYGFDELPAGASSCPTGEQPAIPNPLIYDVMTISDTNCLDTRLCGSEPQCQSNPNNVTLLFSDNGGKIVFPRLTHWVAFEINAHSDFQLRITDRDGGTADVALPALFSSPPVIPIWAFQARAGVAMVELFDFAPNKLSSVFVETTPAPPLSPRNLAARGISPNAIEVTWTDYSLVENGFLVERKV
ncbi:MAG TPA: hypothetical protein VJ063_01440, partial [Verrucomicrobiae bacterium]|nr:hypothetical protein [Verrucomicrobiae bacterium]